MSAIAATTLEKAVLRARDKFMAFEKRRPDLGTVEAFDKYTNLLVQENQIKSLRASARRPVEIAVLTNQTGTIKTERSLTITPDTTVSAKVPFTWDTFGFDVGVTEAVNADNYISAEEDLADQIYQRMRDLLKELDAQGAAFLEAGKWSSLPTTSLMGISGGAYTTTTDKIFINAPAVMRNLELQGPYHALSNVEALANRTNISTFGQYNQQNLEKLMGGYEWGYSKNLEPGEGNQEVYYMVPTGSLGLMSWVEYDCRAGRGSYDAGYKYDTMTMEFTSLSGYNFSVEMGFLYIGEGKNMSATLPGLERAYTEAWSFFVDVSFVKAYSSESGVSPIVKMVAEAPGA